MNLKEAILPTIFAIGSLWAGHRIVDTRANTGPLCGASESLGRVNYYNNAAWSDSTPGLICRLVKELVYNDFHPDNGNIRIALGANGSVISSMAVKAPNDTPLSCPELSGQVPTEIVNCVTHGDFVTNSVKNSLFID